MSYKFGAFRFTYFTDKYEETFNFYTDKIGFEVGHSWDRSEDDKGCVFHAGHGIIEILQQPHNEDHMNEGLDYRQSQGVFMCIQTWEVEELFQKFSEAGIYFKQEIVNQPWGHRTFSIYEPNGLVIYFFQELF